MPEVSDFWLKLDYWVLNNRSDLKRWWVMVLIGVDIFLILFVIWSGVITFWSYQNMNSYVSEIGKNRIVGKAERERNAPKPATTLAIESIQQQESSVYLITVTNPNATWSSPMFALHLGQGDQTSSSRESFLAPNDKRLVILTGDLGSAPNVVYDSFVWQRTPPKTIPTINVTVSQGQHSNVSVTKQGERRMVSQIATTVRNGSMYRINTLKIVAVVRNGTELVGVQQVFVDNLRANEERPVLVEFIDMLPAFTSIELSTEIDVLDPNTLQVDI